MYKYNINKNNADHLHLPSCSQWQHHILMRIVLCCKSCSWDSSSIMSILGSTVTRTSSVNRRRGGSAAAAVQRHDQHAAAHTSGHVVTSLAVSDGGADVDGVEGRDVVAPGDVGLVLDPASV